MTASKIKLIIEGNEYTWEEAKMLWLDLNEIFGDSKTTPFVPYAPPITYPSIPTPPWSDGTDNTQWTTSSEYNMGSVNITDFNKG